MTNLIQRAREFAHAAHDLINQKRKYTGESYWVHTDEVAAIVTEVTSDENVIAAAHLHDTVEDCNIFPYEIVTISQNFGAQVAIYVRELTDVFTSKAFPDLNRATRKDLEAQRLGGISAEAQTIKVADLLSNTKSIVEHDAGFAKTYLKEKKKALTYLTKAHPALLERVKKQLTEAKLSVNL
jgi:(p)ppGpp synthase/HD superfamily hydrolase